MKDIRIKIKGQLDVRWSDWFENFEISFDGENTSLTGKVADQAALHGILNQIRDLNLTLISINSDFDK